MATNKFKEGLANVGLGALTLFAVGLAAVAEANGITTSGPVNNSTKYSDVIRFMYSGDCKVASWYIDDIIDAVRKGEDGWYYDTVLDIIKSSRGDWYKADAIKTLNKKCFSTK